MEPASQSLKVRPIAPRYPITMVIEKGAWGDKPWWHLPFKAEPGDENVCLCMKATIKGFNPEDVKGHELALKAMAYTMQRYRIRWQKYWTIEIVAGRCTSCDKVYWSLVKWQRRKTNGLSQQH